MHNGALYSPPSASACSPVTTALTSGQAYLVYRRHVRPASATRRPILLDLHLSITRSQPPKGPHDCIPPRKNYYGDGRALFMHCKDAFIRVAFRQAVTPPPAFRPHLHPHDAAPKLCAHCELLFPFQITIPGPVPTAPMHHPRARHTHGQPPKLLLLQPLSPTAANLTPGFTSERVRSGNTFATKLARELCMSPQNLPGSAEDTDQVPKADCIAHIRPPGFIRVP